MNVDCQWHKAEDGQWFEFVFGEVNMIASAIKQKMVNGLSLYSEK